MTKIVKTNCADHAEIMCKCVIKSKKKTRKQTIKNIINITRANQ